MADLRALLAEIHARADKATPGPWKLWGMSVQTDRSGTGETNYDEMVARTNDPDRGLRTFNASFIAQARQDVPRLVSMLESVLEYCDERMLADPHHPDGRPDGILVGLQIAATDIRRRLENLAG